METRTIQTDQWYGRGGQRVPTSSIFPASLKNLVLNNRTLKPNAPRALLGFVPEFPVGENGGDPVGSFLPLDDENSPYNINSYYLCNLGVPNDSEAFTRQGATILASSFYINGTIAKPTSVIDVSTVNGVASTQDLRYAHAYQNARNNQVLMAIILEDCRSVNDPDERNWNDILDLNTSPTIELDTRILATHEEDGSQVTGCERFSSPVATIEFNSRSRFRILATRLYDLDGENTLFSIDTYIKLETKPYKGAKYKQKIKVVYVSGNSSGLYKDTIKNMIHMNFLVHGLYKNILAATSTTNNVSTVVTLSNGLPLINTEVLYDQAYERLTKLYPNITFTGKFSFKDS